jgi:TolA-binding protein
MARYTCQDKTVGDWSRKGLQALHANYPNSNWTANTPYWFGGR